MLACCSWPVVDSAEAEKAAKKKARECAVAASKAKRELKQVREGRGEGLDTVRLLWCGGGG